MNRIAWDSTLDTGHAGLDAGHNELAELFNRLLDAVDKREGNAAYAELLDKIIAQARAHFALEQQLMAEYRYPKSEQHQAEHVMLIDQALDYRATFEAQCAASPVAVAGFPEVWLAFHVLFSDKQLADFLARNA